MADRKLLDRIVCPKCKGDVEYIREDERLVCRTCHLGFPVEDGMPNMLLEEAEELEV